jgi:hypothetical protein
MTPLTLTDRDVLGANASTGNVSTFSTETQLVEWKAQRRLARQGEVEYLISAGTIRRLPTSSQAVSSLAPAQVAVSPAWFGRVKKRLNGLASLPLDWDSYGGIPADPRAARLAEEMIEWFAVDGVPPPDVFANGDGGVQLEWHINGVDAVISFSSDDETSVTYQDLSDDGESWSGAASDSRLQTIRKRLLSNL